MRDLRRTAGTLACVVALAGCGAAGVSPELADARLSMERARASEADRYAPRELHSAEELLARAEREKEGSRLERHFAYLADRQARIAIAGGNTGVAKTETAMARQEYVAALERGAIQRDESRQQLSDAQRRVLDAQQAAAEADVARLEAERHAEQSDLQRVAAEERERAALEQIAEVRDTPDSTIITLTGEVIFGSADSELRPSARARLTAVADALKASPHGAILVAGHTDSHGTARFNEALSARRAAAVRDFLIEQGVAEQQIEAVGRGEAEPVASNDSPEGRADNRRVEIIVKNAPR